MPQEGKAAKPNLDTALFIYTPKAAFSMPIPPLTYFSPTPKAKRITKVYFFTPIEKFLSVKYNVIH
jgi:hypothetical protein